MNPQPHNKVPVFKLALVFTGFMLIVNAIANLISVSFKTDYFLSWDYLKFEVGLEALGVFLCAIFTALITSKLSDFKFGTVFIRILVFAVIYLSFSLLLEGIIYFYLGSMDYYKTNFKLFNTGMRCSFLFLVVWMVLKYQQKRTTHHE